MEDSHSQMVFPFLLDDPLYRRHVREERIISEVREALEPVLQEKMLQIISDMAETGFKEKLESIVRDAVQHAEEEIQAIFSDIRLMLFELLHHFADSHDPADWWKRGAEPDEDCEVGDMSTSGESLLARH